MNLRDSAKGQQCLVRVPCRCNANPETTVLAHYRIVGISGAGLKSPDFLAAFACSDCHDLVDGRANSANFTRDDLQKMHLEGVLRTQLYWLRNGMIQI